MYWKYCVRRVLNGIITFAVIILLLSILFDTVMEKTVRFQIDKEVHAEQSVMSFSRMNAEEIEEFTQKRKEQKYKLYGLDKPRSVRIGMRTIKILAFQFGKSSHIRSASGSTDVWQILMEVIPRTVYLFTSAIIASILLGLWLGIKQAQKAGSFMDKGTSMATLVVYGMPSWWLGMLIIILFAYVFKLFPSGGLTSTPPPQGFLYVADLLYHMVLPVLTLVVLGFWGMAFLIRNIVLGILQEDYVMAARARGIPENKVLFGHALRTAAPPITTMAVLSLLASVSGNIIFEGIFSWPGLGNLYWIAIEQNDVPVLMGALFVTTGLYIFGLVLLDLIYGYLDPRIKVGGKS